jgi:putative FmdB family regulatory protein
MPMYDYRCNECGNHYDVFHKVREVAEDVVCPSCQSTRHTRLLSAPNVSIKGSGSAADFLPASSCETGGGCCGGWCNSN